MPGSDLTSLCVLHYSVATVATVGCKDTVGCKERIVQHSTGNGTGGAPVICCCLHQEDYVKEDCTTFNLLPGQ